MLPSELRERNFAWFYPRKGDHVHFQVCTGEDMRGQFIAINGKKRDCLWTNSHPCTLKISLKMAEMENNRDIIRSVLAKAEEFSRE
jgi:hypothetical protein